jgi:thioredoxin 1
MKLMPVLDSLAGQFAGRVKVGKVNVNDNFDLASEYNVINIPRVLIFNKNSKPLHELKGLVSEAELVKLLNGVVGT